MSNISIKLNLQQLHHVIREVKGKDGNPVKILILPIEENNFFQGEKGTYLDLTAIELKEKKTNSKDTHLIKQDLPKAVYEKMSEEERKATPIIGNAVYWGRREAQPVTSNALGTTTEDEPFDDLPF